MIGTKLKIFNAAVDLFYEYGYSNVGVREIAAKAGIKSSSIYNHFESKGELFEQIHRYFRKYYVDTLPYVEEVMALIPLRTPYEVYEELQLPKAHRKMYDILSKILHIVIHESIHNVRSQALVSELYEVTSGRIHVVLAKMVKEKTIQPINVDTITSVLVQLSLSTVPRSDKLRTLTVSDWRASHRLIFELISTGEQSVSA